MKKLSTEAWKSAVPVGMRVLPRWVGHEKKRPISLRGGGAGKVDDPKTWASFEEAVRFYREHEANPDVGVGFVFNGDGISFVDVDKVLSDVQQDPTGVVRDFRWTGPPAVKTLFEGVSAETYVEVSPSGTGLHVFGLGRLPEDARQKREPVEVYSTGRYSTVTGYALGTARALRAFQPRLDRIAEYVGTKDAPESTEEQKPEPERAAEAAAALAHLNPDMPYEDWLRVGMALKAGLGAKGRDLWLAWSYEGKKAVKGEPEEKWSSFRKGGIGLGSLFHMAYGESEARPSAEEEFAAFAAPEQPEEKRTSGLRLIALEDVRKEKVDWLWRGRFAKGHIALVAGDGGKGKSIMTLDLSSRISAGRPLPGEDAPRPPGRVLLLNVEDGQADTIRPRAEAAGADLSRILVLDLLNGGRPPQLPDDIPLLEQVIKDAGDIELVVLDPLNACIPVRLDAHKDQHVRQALQPLAALAQKYHVAIALVVHLNKASDAAATLYRVSGSIGIGAAARSVLFVGPHPDDENDRVVAQAKPQLGPPPASLAFRVRGLPEDPDIGVVEWLGETDADASDLAPRRSSGGGEEHGKGEAAAAWLEKRLEAGPVGATEVFTDGKSAGFGRNSVKNAAKRLGVQKEKQGKTGGWVWKLDTFKAAPAAAEEIL